MNASAQADKLNASVKADLRAQALIRRRDAFERSATAGRQIADLFLQNIAWRPDQVVSGYVPIGQEADVMPLLQALALRHVGLALPVVTERSAPLRFRAWAPGDALEQAGFNCRQPLAVAAWADPDLLLVPMLAFDRSGARLGYGGGYYDRTLSALRRDRPITAIGIAFAAQEWESLPCDPHDQRLDFIVTEQGVLEILA